MIENTDLFRESMSRLAGAVSIVTSKVDNRDWSLTISSVCSISMDPPLLMVSLQSDKVSTKSILSTNEFKVNLLSEEQISLAKFGAKPGTPKFLDEYFSENNSNKSQLTEDSLATIQCNLYKSIEAGDHTILLGLVKEVELGNLTKPLLYYSRDFRTTK